MFEVKSLETRDKFGKIFVSKVEHMQVLNGTEQGVRRSERPLLER